MSMDMSDVLTDPDMISPFQLVRWLSGGRDADSGVWTSQYDNGTTITESIQPSSASDMLQFLPEGDRGKQSCTIYSKTPIRMGDGVATESDLIVWMGQTYRVSVSQQWSQYGYYFVMATQTTPLNVKDNEDSDAD